MKQDMLEEGAVYHIFNRGNNKENIFKTDENYYYFINKTRFFLKPYCDLYAYCLMPNHFHFLLRIKDVNELKAIRPKRISQPFSNLFNSYTKSYNKYFSRTGSVFQEHFHRERIKTEEYFRNVFIYIHNNPVNHGFVNEAKDYKWSSWKEYLTNYSNFLDVDYPLQVFDGIESARHMVDSHKEIIISL